MKLSSRFLRFTLIIISSIGLLSACSNEHAQIMKQYEVGKTFFANKQYAEAFPKLYAAAQNGEPEAQYAIGYMYYYGQGAAKNPELGLSWIKQAAKNGNTAAKKALELIDQDNISKNDLAT
jgi:TPR repeat protein